MAGEGIELQGLRHQHEKPVDTLTHAAGPIARQARTPAGSVIMAGARPALQRGAPTGTAQSPLPRARGVRLSRRSRPHLAVVAGKLRKGWLLVASWAPPRSAQARTAAFAGRSAKCRECRPFERASSRRRVGCG